MATFRKSPQGPERLLGAFALRGRVSYLGLCWFLLLGADRIEALLQRIHQVDDPGWRLDRRRDDLFPGDLGFDDVLQPLAVFVFVIGQIERPLERREDGSQSAGGLP